MKNRVAVLKGGLSAEREVSLKSGRQVAEALRSKDFWVTEIDVDRRLPANLDAAMPDVVFIALHGRYGEDGSVQGLLEILGIPYVGSGVSASALAMDKTMSKRIFRDLGIPTPRFETVSFDAWKNSRDEIRSELITKLSPPWVVKPSREGSSIGMSFPKTPEALEGGIDAALCHDDEVLIEEYVSGEEITVGILEDKDLGLIAFPTLEVVSGNGHYDYEAKYTPGASEHIIPARIEEDKRKAIQEMAKSVHRALGCRDLSRVDFKLSASGEPLVLEINTLPGMTEMSLYPEAAAAMGIGFADLVERLINRTLERGPQKTRSAENTASLLA